MWPTDTIKTNINTGDPAFPFPQFLEYDNGKTLAKYNSEGVTHADMEKSMREAYQIMMHRCLYVPGKSLNGTKYIIYNHKNVPENNNTFVSEGDGYALLAAAYFADKPTFDGLWLWIHDNRLSRVKKYFDCTDLRPKYRYGKNLPGWKNDETTGATDPNNDHGDNNSATDGDYDIAMALLIAYAQWGELMGIKDACNTDISYKNEALNMIKAIVDTVPLNSLGSSALTGYLSGDIGIDGYCKNGNTWDEITGWRYNVTNQIFTNSHLKPEAFSQSKLYTDYIGPAYFNQFAKFLTLNGGTTWQINQYKRGEASSDWLIGQMYAKGYLASSGNCTVSDDGTLTTFGPHPIEPGGEDFRASWRTILNYVWHGNPSTSWNPVTHQVTNTPNSFEKNMALRHAAFLKEPGNPKFCAKFGTSPDPASPNFKGVGHIKQGFSTTGTTTANYNTNYNVGTGAPSAVASEDLELIGEMYRQAEIMWDDASKKSSGLSDAQRYILSTPVYFHDWFRLLGMLTNSGNLHPPTTMVPSANIKCYMSVDKTYAYSGDLITYTVNYRNYGSITATDVILKTTLDADYSFISASNGGTISGNTITWNIGNVNGFTTAGGIPASSGKVTFLVKVKNQPPNPRVCETSTITASNNFNNLKNDKIWTSNEYPNNATYTMERNCVDILGENRTLVIKKTVDRPVLNPGDIANFKLEFENKSTANAWLNGGRDKVVISYGNYLFNYTFYQFYRFWHFAPEAYINMNNYRISYFMNDAAAIGLYDATTNPTGWDFKIDNQSDLDKYGYNPATGPITFTYQKIPSGTDANGSWNQRLVTRFANVLTAPTSHIFDKLDNLYLIHKGVYGPGFIRTKLESIPSSVLTSRVADDWSYSFGVDVGQIAAQNAKLFPVTNSWANFSHQDSVVNNYGKDVCDPNVVNFKKVLVEEYDGYTWRRILGNGPLPGREAYDVIVYDTIPKELSWSGFTDDMALNVKATYTAAPANAAYTGIVKWTIPSMLVGEKGDLAYKTIAKDPPCPSPDKNFINVAWISSKTDSPDSSQVNLTITCTKVPPLAPTETSLFKTANVKNVAVGDLIKYTLKFKNNDGSTSNWPSASSDWQALGLGVVPDLNQTTISLDQNNNTNKPGTYGYAFGNKYAHGKNGWIEATLPKNNSKITFVFRNSSGTPGQSDFKGVMVEANINPAGNNTIEFKVYINNNLFTTLNGISYGGAVNPMNLKVELIDDQIFIWINDYSGLPLKSISGITQLTPGYGGIFGSSSTQTISSITSHFDSAFDIVISDPIPSDLNNIGNISNGGTLTGATITWPKISGPILAGDSLIRTFEANVKSCSNFITNIGKAVVYGNNNIQSQYVVNCATTTPLFFIDFSAHENGKNTVVLDWSVAHSEKGTFSIQGSLDNNNFVELNKTDAIANKTAYHLAVVNDISYSYFKVVFVSSNKQVNSKTVKINTESTGISLYPNPFDNEITLQIQNENIYTAKIISVTGAELGRISNISKGTHRLGGALPSGIYLIEVSSEEGFEHFKIVKE